MDKTPKPGQPNTMTAEEFATWKRDRELDQVVKEVPTPKPKRDYECEDCGRPIASCACQSIDHPDDESGTRVTPDGALVMLNEGGHNGTRIDVRTLVAWLREHRPELLT